MSNVSATFFEQWHWGIQILLFWLITVVGIVLLQKIRCRFLRDSTSFYCAVLDALSRPAVVLICLNSLSVSIDILYEQFPAVLLHRLLGMRIPALVMVIGWFLLRLNKHCFAMLAQKATGLSPGSLDLAKKISTAVIVVSLGLMFLPSVGISINGILAFGGIGGVIVGLAAKDMLANVFGAVMIHIDHPFAVGDWISLPEKNIQGTVESIGWRQIVIRTFDTRQLFIPNSLFGNIILENPDRMTHRRILETVGVRYDDTEKLPSILAEIRYYLDQNPYIDKQKDRVVHLVEFGAYSVNFVISAYTSQTKWSDFLQVKESVLLAVSTIIKEYQGEIAFPTQVMHIKER